MKKFVNYLDTYKNVSMTTNDYWYMMHNINMHYYRIGPSIVPYYPNSYENWQSENEAVITPESIKPVDIFIDTNIDSIEDLLKIIDENPLSHHKNYNIDLKALHKIQPQLKRIQSMIGLSKFKEAVLEQLLYFIQNLHLGSKDGDFKHTVLAGPPGTGKTEVAKLMGEMYSKLGVLKNNVFKKVTRSDLVAGYLGQTALKTQKVIESCLGGVLFIDEAYSLGDSSDSFSRECVDTLCEALSAHKGELMVIIAGYHSELTESFFKMNAGLPSRFVWRFSMEPYSAKELHAIFVKKVTDNDWSTDNSIPIGWFEKRKDKFIHYGRDMEILFTYTKISHGRRIYGKGSENRKKISIEDLNKGYKTFLENNGSNTVVVAHSMYM
jgi:DNA helicase TIP49 (TBP-interacting protein)